MIEIIVESRSPWGVPGQCVNHHVSRLTVSRLTVAKTFTSEMYTGCEGDYLNPDRSGMRWLDVDVYLRLLYHG